MYKQKHLTILVLISACFILSSCDMISSIKEYFKTKDKNPTVHATKTVAQPTQKPKIATTQPKATATMNKPKSPLPKNVYARIGDWQVTVVEIKERIAAAKQQDPKLDINADDINVKAAIVDEMLRQQLLFLDAEKKGVDKKKEIVDALAEVKKALLVQDMTGQIIGNITVTEKEAKEVYDTVESPLFYTPLEVKIREIVVGSQIKATELLLEIQKGADFATIARDNSIGSTSAQGGDLGFIAEPPFPKMGDVILSLLKEEGNDISSAFKGPKGYYIIKIEDQKGGEKKPFADVKDLIVEQMTLQKRETALAEYLKKLQKEYNVEINEALLTVDNNAQSQTPEVGDKK